MTASTTQAVDTLYPKEYVYYVEGKGFATNVNFTKKKFHNFTEDLKKATIDTYGRARRRRNMFSERGVKVTLMLIDDAKKLKAEGSVRIRQNPTVKDYAEGKTYDDIVVGYVPPATKSSRIIGYLLTYKGNFVYVSDHGILELRPSPRDSRFYEDIGACNLAIIKIRQKFNFDAEVSPLTIEM